MYIRILYKFSSSSCPILLSPLCASIRAFTLRFVPHIIHSSEYRLLLMSVRLSFFGVAVPHTLRCCSCCWCCGCCYCSDTKPCRCPIFSFIPRHWVEDKCSQAHKHTHTYKCTRVCVCIKYKTSSRFTVAVGSHRRRRRRRRFLPPPLGKHLPLAYFAHIFDSIAYNKFSCPAPDPPCSLCRAVQLYKVLCIHATFLSDCPTVSPSYLSPSLSVSLPLRSVATPFPNAFSPARFGFLISVLILRFVLFRCDFD